MFCSKCGSSISDGSRFCEKCGARIDFEPSTGNASGDNFQLDGMDDMGIDFTPEAERGVGDIITIKTTKEATFGLLGGGVLTTKVELFDDRLTIETDTKRFTDLPVVYYSEIADISEKLKYFPLIYIENVLLLILLIVCISAFPTPLICAACIAINFIFMRNVQLTILLKSGKKVRVYGSWNSDEIAQLKEKIQKAAGK